MTAFQARQAVASVATREHVRAAAERISRVSLEPHARIGTLLIYGPEGYQSSGLVREALAYLPEWTKVVGVADERERDIAWSFLEVLNQSLAPFDVQVETPLSSRETDDDPQSVGRSFADALAAIGAPVCVVVERMHWVDEQSAAAIRFGMRRHGEQRQMLLMASESLANENEQLIVGLAQTRPEHNEVVRLPPLTSQDVHELAIELIGRPVAGRVARRLIADTEGNPTLVAELLDVYRDEVRTALHPAALDLDSARLIPLLPHQQRALASAALGARTAAEIVAVLREPTAVASVNRVAAWLGITESFGAFDLQAAEELGLVRVVNGPDVVTVEPPSRVVADVIAAGVPFERRREIHAAAADVLTGVAVFRHRIRAMNDEDTTLVSDLMDGTRAVLTSNDPERAMSLALAAVRLARPGVEYERALLLAGTLALRLHEHQCMFHLLGEIASLPKSPLRNVILADLEVLTGFTDAGVALARDVVDGPAESPTEQALRAHAAVMIPLYDAVHDHHELVPGHVEAARRVLAETSVTPDAVDPELRWLVRPTEHELWLTTWELVAAARVRDSARIADRMARLDQLLRTAPDSAAAVDALLYQARTLAHAGHVTDAANRLERAARASATHRDAWMRHTVLTMQAHLLFLTGEWDRAQHTAMLALDSALDDPYRDVVPTAYGASGMVPAARGEVQEVRRIERMLALTPRGPDGAIPYGPDLPDIMRAELAAALGDPIAQLQATDAARTAARKGTVWSWLYLHIDALAQLGGVSDASLIVTEALSGRTPWLRTPYGAARLRARIALARGELEQAIELYAGLVQSVTAAGQPFELARDRLHFAQALHESGDARRALQQLELASATFRNLRADTYLRRAGDLAHDFARTTGGFGAAPGAAGSGTGSDSAGETSERGAGSEDAARHAPCPHRGRLAGLTVREREVALAVAAGLTNREVAAQLFVSVTTVNFHVRNILAKLGLSSRRELRSIVGDEGR